MSRPLARDTSPGIEDRQVAAWREMPAARKADLISALSGAAREMAQCQKFVCEAAC